MSKFTDELFNLCVAIVDSQHVDKLFLNFGHNDNFKLFEEYIRDMSDIAKLYAIYDYDVYYQGDIVTEEILKQAQENALVLPIYKGMAVDVLSNIWANILSKDKCKERTDSALDCLTNKFALIDRNICSDSFINYVSSISPGVRYYPIDEKDDIINGVKLNESHVLVVGDAAKLADFEIELKKFFNLHLTKTL
jgi:hypothetical protein